MAHKRVLRVAEALKRELGVILDRKLEDPKLGMVTVTRTEISDDLRYAKVYVSFLGGSEAPESLRRLRRARKFLRCELAGCLRLRVVPELTFFLDESAENYLRIASVLDDIHEEDAHREPIEDDGDEAASDNTTADRADGDETAGEEQPGGE